MSGLLTLAWVDEVMPDIVQHGDWENPDERIEFPDERLTVAMRNHLLRTVGQGGDGEHTCQAQGCSSGRSDGPAFVGYLIVDREDSHGRETEGYEWRWTSVIEFPDGRIILVCEDCTPTNLYAPGA